MLKTGLLRTNTVAAKRNLLTERTGLGKSVSVSLRQNVPKPFGVEASPAVSSEVLIGPRFDPI